MVVKICPRCQQSYSVGFDVEDFAHECNSGNPTLDQEDVLEIGNWEDYTGSGVETNPMQKGAANKLWGSRGQIEGETDHSRTRRGANATTHRQRQHIQFIDLKGFWNK